MSEEQTKTQPIAQAGSSGEAAAVGSKVGGVNSSSIGRRDAACSHAPQKSKGAGNGSKEIITPKRFGSSNTRCIARPRPSEMPCDEAARKAGFGNSVRPV